MRNRAAQDGKDDGMQMTPMIDVTFLLLVFFMCTLQFKTLEGKLAAYLPRDVGSNIPAAEPPEAIDLRVVVLREGTRLDPSGTRPWSPASGRRFVYANDRVVQYRIGPVATTDPTIASRRLRELHRASPDRTLEIDARPGVIYGDVVFAVDLALNAGIRDIRFVRSSQR